MKTNIKIYNKVIKEIIKINEITKSWYDFYISALYCNWYTEKQSKVQKYNKNRICNLQRMIPEKGGIALQTEEKRQWNKEKPLNQ